MQLLELGFPMVVALNMMDELRENGGSVLVNEMEEALGVPVIPISAAKAEGIEELIQHAIHVAKYQEKPLETDFCRKEEGVHRGIHAVMHLIEDHAEKQRYRFGLRQARSWKMMKNIRAAESDRK